MRFLFFLSNLGCVGDTRLVEPSVGGGSEGRLGAEAVEAAPDADAARRDERSVSPFVALVHSRPERLRASNCTQLYPIASNCTQLYPICTQGAHPRDGTNTGRDLCVLFDPLGETWVRPQLQELVAFPLFRNPPK